MIGTLGDAFKEDWTGDDAIDMGDDVVVVIILGYIRTRSSTDVIMATAPLSPPRAFFILSTKTSELTTVATTFLVVYARSIVPSLFVDDSILLLGVRLGSRGRPACSFAKISLHMWSV